MSSRERTDPVNPLFISFVRAYATTLAPEARSSFCFSMLSIYLHSPSSFTLGSVKNGCFMPKKSNPSPSPSTLKIHQLSQKSGRFTAFSDKANDKFKKKIFLTTPSLTIDHPSRNAYTSRQGPSFYLLTPNFVLNSNLPLLMGSLPGISGRWSN